MKFSFDCHCHTEASACAEGATRELYQNQKSLPGFSFAVTDHSAHIIFPWERRWAMWDDDADDLYNQCLQAGIEKCYAHLQWLREVQHPRMLIGMEVDVTETGRIVMEEELFNEFDIFLGAIHCLKALKREQADDIAIAEFQLRVCALIDAGAQVIAHPFREFGTNKRDVPDGLLQWLVDTAIRTDVALELNCHYQMPQMDLALARMCLEKGVRLAIGTDTHRLHEFGDFSYHETILREIGVLPGEEAQYLLGVDDLTSAGVSIS